MTIRVAGLAAVICTSLATMVWAKAPTVSLRPDARPVAVAAVTPAPVSRVAAQPATDGLLVSPLPVGRPGGSVVVSAARAPVTTTPAVAATPPAVSTTASMSGAAVGASPRPDRRPGIIPPAKVVRASVRSQPATVVATSARGSICGVRTIRGQALSPIPGKLRGCGVANPVRVTSVDGVALTQPATINCDAAKALNKWVKTTVKPAVGSLGGGVKSLRVIAHYSCRTRNNVPGAKISEHGRGNALDIAAINLSNGTSLSVLRGWNDRVQGPVLKKVHAGACGTFGTVLGPRSDRFHRDHFHLDVARNRGGAYCR